MRWFARNRRRPWRLGRRRRSRGTWRCLNCASLCKAWVEDVGTKEVPWRQVKGNCPVCGPAWFGCDGSIRNGVGWLVAVSGDPAVQGRTARAIAESPRGFDVTVAAPKSWPGGA